MSIFDKFKEISMHAPTGPPEYIIAGLGNPGDKYEGTRHNAGFTAIDALAKRFNTELKRIKFKSLCANVTINSKRCLLIKPQTFMNNSGQAVEEAMAFYKITAENVIVIYDDISLEPGKLRIRRKGSDGGHNGIKSIIYLTGADTFPRIKIGVGRKPHPKYDLADWVLGKFSSEDREKIDEALEKVCDSIELMTGGRTDEAMNKYNS